MPAGAEDDERYDPAHRPIAGRRKRLISRLERNVFTLAEYFQLPNRCVVHIGSPIGD
jgi:hypothetical protein